MKGKTIKNRIGVSWLNVLHFLSEKRGTSRCLLQSGEKRRAVTHDITEVRKEADLYGTAPQPVLL